MASYDENSEITPLFACDPCGSQLQHVNHTEFKRWLDQIMTKIDDTNGELHIDVPSASEGIYILETGPELYPIRQIF